MKLCVRIGYTTTAPEEPGSDIYINKIVERECYGETTRVSSKWQNSGHVNDDISINNEISIMADPFAMQNFSNIAYAEFLGTKWKVQAIEIQYPRLLLTVGGVYNAID